MCLFYNGSNGLFCFKKEGVLNMEGYELMILSLIVGLALFTLASFGSDCNKDDKKDQHAH